MKYLGCLLLLMSGWCNPMNKNILSKKNLYSSKRFYGFLLFRFDWNQIGTLLKQRPKGTPEYKRIEDILQEKRTFGQIYNEKITLEKQLLPPNIKGKLLKELKEEEACFKHN